MKVTLRRRSPHANPVRVLLMHGLAGSGRVWDEFVELAADRLEVWDAELPWGSPGEAGWAEDPDVARWAICALDLVEGGVDVVVAHSFGANVLLAALDQAGPRNPDARDALSAVVLVSPFYRPAPERFDWAGIEYYLNDFDRILEEGISVRARRRLDPDIQHRMALRARDRVGPYGWVRFFDTYLRTPTLAVDRLDLPFLVVAGGDDFAAFPADSEALASALPSCEFHVLPDCAHFAMVERAGEFAALVNTFTEQVKSADNDRAWESAS